MNVTAPFQDVLHRTFLNNSVATWLAAAITAAVVLLVPLVLRHLLVSRLRVVAARTVNQVDDMALSLLTETRTWVLVAVAILAGLGTLALPARAHAVIAPASKLVILWQLALWGAEGVGFWVKHHLTSRTGTSDRASIAMISAMGVGAKVLLWVLIFLTALKSVFGVEITALITGLGVSGIAVALAVQNILGDLLAALAIVFDKPFDVGDAIGVDDISGTVERIGLKTTHIRSTNGEQIIIGNGDLLKSRLHNYRRMSQRRVLFDLDVTYDTPNEVLKRLPSVIEEIVSAQPKVRFDRAHVASFGESAIRIEVVYYLLDPDYKLYMDNQQVIYLEVLRRFGAMQVKFAFPSRTLYHEGSAVGKGLAVGER